MCVVQKKTLVECISCEEFYKDGKKFKTLALLPVRVEKWLRLNSRKKLVCSVKIKTKLMILELR